MPKFVLVHSIVDEGDVELHHYEASSIGKVYRHVVSNEDVWQFLAVVDNIAATHNMVEVNLDATLPRNSGIRYVNLDRDACASLWKCYDALCAKQQCGRFSLNVIRPTSELTSDTAAFRRSLDDASMGNIFHYHNSLGQGAQEGVREGGWTMVVEPYSVPTFESI